MVFRLQVYDFKDKHAEYPLINDNIIVAGVQKKGLVTIDLSSYGLVIENNVLVALEWIKDDGAEGNQGIMFRSKKGGKNNFYTRKTSHTPFISMKEWIAMAPNIRLGFYLEGRELNE